MRTSVKEFADKADQLKAILGLEIIGYDPGFLMADRESRKSIEIPEILANRIIEALAASQRRGTVLQAEIRRMDEYKAQLHALNDQLQARLDAAEALVPLFYESGRDMSTPSQLRIAFTVCAHRLQTALIRPSGVWNEREDSNGE